MEAGILGGRCASGEPMADDSATAKRLALDEADSNGDRGSRSTVETPPVAGDELGGCDDNNEDSGGCVAATAAAAAAGDAANGGDRGGVGCDGSREAPVSALVSDVSCGEASGSRGAITSGDAMLSGAFGADGSIAAGG